MEKSEFSCPNCGKKYTSEPHFNKHVAQCAPGRDQDPDVEEVLVRTDLDDTGSKPLTGEEIRDHAHKYSKNAYRVDDVGKYVLVYCPVGLLDSVITDISTNHKLELVTMIQLKNRNILMSFKKK